MGRELGSGGLEGGAACGRIGCAQAGMPSAGVLLLTSFKAIANMLLQYSVGVFVAYRGIIKEQVPMPRQPPLLHPSAFQSPSCHPSHRIWADSARS